MVCDQQNAPVRPRSLQIGMDFLGDGAGVRVRRDMVGSIPRALSIALTSFSNFLVGATYTKLYRFIGLRIISAMYLHAARVLPAEHGADTRRDHALPVEKATVHRLWV